MPFMRSRQRTVRLPMSTDSQMLDAIRRARKDPSLPQDEPVKISAVAQVSPKYWSVPEHAFRTFMSQRMTPEQRHELRLIEPKRQNSAA
jgi:hypothetical protein